MKFKGEFKIGFINNDKEFYQFTKPEYMTVSEGINKCKEVFWHNEFSDVCLAYDWGSDVNIIFEINKENNNGILETEAQLMIKEEFKINI